MQVLILEDEQLAAERLRILLRQCDPGITICGVIDSVQDAVVWLKNMPQPDLLFMDIELADGKSFELFRHIDYQGPVIFTTAYDQYALDAFKYYSIDYLLKPVTQESLQGALNKLQTITNTQPPRLESLVENLQQKSRAFKSRFLARAGQRLFFVSEEEVQFFIADNKIVHLVDLQGNKLLVDYTLEKLETLLNPDCFFRLNRKVIARFSGIKQVKPYMNGRLKVSFKSGLTDGEDTIISRERVAPFKQWADSV
jgi:DNA-binding LytR/AlgR family response regulator